MARHWYLIDERGTRRIDVAGNGWDFWSDFREGADTDSDRWPAFVQLAVRSELDDAVAAFEAAAPDLGLEVDDITPEPEQWDDGLCFGWLDPATLVAEPGVDLDDSALAQDLVDQVVGQIGCDAALFGHDPGAETVWVAIWRDGRLVLSWCDSVAPGPSHATVFHDDGTATDEDPRKFALRELGYPETSPFLDRYAFVEQALADFGVASVDPDLARLPIARVLRLRPHPKARHG